MVNQIGDYFLIFLCIFLLILGAFLMAYGTIKKNRFGINFKGLTGVENKCPSCGNKFDQIRRPNDMYEMLWGGWTCKKCGKKYDKWGGSRNPV